ncbi:MAG: hypothetical protein JWP22_4421 [Ramlibacter sp.]|jgi:hypothetical protein|nr:hypothetical protein [Ramlibacter sp.]MDB5915746.1 hypothetical protein [Ramlibacter sp.]
MKRMCQAFVAIAAFGAAGIASAHGHGRLAIRFGFPVAGPVYAAPPPVYYVQPRVVYVAPPPVYYQPSYVYYGPVTVYRPAPPTVYERSERREALPAPAQPQPPAPALPPRAYRN